MTWRPGAGLKDGLSLYYTFETMSAVPTNQQGQNSMSTLLYRRKYMLGNLPLLALLTFLSSATAQDSLYIKDHYTKSEFYITMRDGVRLFTSVYSPKDTTSRYPIILNRDPYGVDPYGLSSTRVGWCRP